MEHNINKNNPAFPKYNVEISDINPIIVIILF